METIEAAYRSCSIAHLGDPKNLEALTHLLTEDVEGTPNHGGCGLA